MTFDFKLINQAEAARKLGISQPYLWEIINGKKRGKKPQKILEELKRLLKEEMNKAA